MNILVTGASGFIGRRLSARLAALGHHVFGLSLKAPADPSLGFEEYYQKDISKPFLLDRSFDLVVHLAAYNITHIGIKDDRLYTSVNIEGTRNLLKAVDTKHFIYLSTAKVYMNEGKALTEGSPVSPQAAYEQSKLKAEEECLAHFRKGSLVILRSVNCFGWGQASKAVLPVFFEKAKKGQPLEIMNFPRTPMQFIYVEDLIDAIEALINRKDQQGIFNIAYEEPISLEQLAMAVVEMTHSSSILNIPHNALERVFSPVHCRKAHQLLGWKAQTGIRKILELYDIEYARAA